MQPSPLPILDGKYQLVRQLGEGGMGTVYEARHRGTGRRVAVKIIVGEALAQSSADVLRRFQREAMATGAIESQYIAHALDTGTDPASGAPYLVMDLLVGEDLQQALQRLGPLAPDVALRVAAQACLGLQKAHEAGVVHRDIKPGNLFLTRRERNEVLVKILDFGIAKVKMDQFSTSQNVEMTRTGSVVGTPLYMSPEQARGKKDIDHRTDVWSLGVVLYEALTGRTPHRDPDTIGDLIVQICAEEPLPLQDYAPWVPPEVAAIVQKALSRDPARRFASASAMFDAISALLPKGDDLDVAAFVSLTPEARSHVAPRLPPPTEVPPPPSSLPAMAPQSIPSRAVSDALYSRTTAGFSRSPWSSRPPASRARQLAAGLLALVAVAAVVFVVAHRDHPGAPVAASSPPPHAVTPSPLTPPPVLPSPSPAVTSVPVITPDALPVASATPPAPAAASSPLPAPRTSKKASSPAGPAATPAHVSVPAAKKPPDDDLYKP